MKQTVKTSRTAGQLEKMFRELNTHYFNGELPEPIISLKKTPGAYGHFTCGKVWQAGTEHRYEINIKAGNKSLHIPNFGFFDRVSRQSFLLFAPMKAHLQLTIHSPYNGR